MSVVRSRDGQNIQSVDRDQEREGERKGQMLANALIPLHLERHFSRLPAGREHSMLYAAREREERLELSQVRAGVKTLFKFTKLNGH